MHKTDIILKTGSLFWRGIGGSECSCACSSGCGSWEGTTAGCGSDYKVRRIPGSAIMQYSDSIPLFV